MRETAVERILGQFLVVDFPDRDDRVIAEPAGDDQGLVLVVADDADTGVPGEFVDVVVELGAELGVGDIVDPAGDAVFGITDGQAAALGSQVGVIISSIKNVAYTVVIRDDAEKAAHR